MSEPMVGFTEVKAKCVACGEEKAVSACWNVTGGWLCAACDSVGRVWAARMARNPEKVFDVPLITCLESLSSSSRYILAATGSINIGPSTISAIFDADKPITVEVGK